MTAKNKFLKEYVAFYLAYKENARGLIEDFDGYSILWSQVPPDKMRVPSRGFENGLSNLIYYEHLIDKTFKPIIESISGLSDNVADIILKQIAYGNQTRSRLALHMGMSKFIAYVGEIKKEILRRFLTEELLKEERKYEGIKN